MKPLIPLTALTLILGACGGEVTDGGTGSDTDFEEIERENLLLAEPEREQIAREGGDEEGYIGQPLQEGADKVEADALRAEDYPAPGEEMTRWPIEPGNEEPGGKDMLLAQEYAAMGEEVPETQRPALLRARQNAEAGLVTFGDRTYLTARGASAAALMNSEAVLRGGDRVGGIADLVLHGDGRIEAVLLEPGGMAGLGEGYRAVPASAAVIEPRMGEMGGPFMMIEAVPSADVPRFERDDLGDDLVLASALIGGPVTFGMGGQGQIADIVVTTGNRIEGIVLALQGERYALPWAALGESQTDGRLHVRISLTELRERPGYVGEPAYSAAQ